MNRYWNFAVMLVAALSTYSATVLAGGSFKSFELSPTQESLLELTLRAAANEQRISDVKHVTQAEMNQILSRMLDSRMTTLDLMLVQSAVRSAREVDFFQREDAAAVLHDIIDVRLRMERMEAVPHPEFGKLKCWLALNADPNQCLSKDSPSYETIYGHPAAKGDEDRMIVGFCDARTNDGKLFRASRRCEIREVSPLRLDLM